MLKKLAKLRLLFLICATFLLCQCAKVVNSSEPMIQPQPDKHLESPYKIPTAAYLAQAKTQQGQQKQNSLLLAAGSMIAHGHPQQGLAILTQTEGLTADQLQEKKLLQAQVSVTKENYKQALIELAAIKEPNHLSLYYQIQFHELLAQSFRATDKTIESISERIKLEHLLVDKQSLNDNSRSLWLSVLNIPVSELNTLALETKSPELQGWMNLALISHKYKNQSKSLLAALDQWQTQYSNHPANRILPDPLDSISSKIVNPPKQVALLIPTSGPFSGPGTAVRDGFIAAQKAHHDKQTIVKVYDTNKGEIQSIYQQALQEGAEYVVGPLLKNQVTQVAHMNHPVPTLLLNEAQTNIQDNSYSFGLSPAQEAIQTAIKAKAKGLSKSLIIAPSNDWGRDVTIAFKKQWQQSGGTVVDTFFYGLNKDLSQKMPDFLHIKASEQREKQMKQLLGQDLQVAINRRQDFDMIFLVAYPTQARQIMPLLKYYYAGDVPVYATSSVYSGSANALKDKDLDGLIFCDIPWVFSHQMGARNWPEQFNSYNRLYALGRDSYALATQLNQLILFPANGSPKHSGILYLNGSQQVARVLEWGQFRQGLAHSMGQIV